MSCFLISAKGPWADCHPRADSRTRHRDETLEQMTRMAKLRQVPMPPVSVSLKNGRSLDFGDPLQGIWTLPRMMQEDRLNSFSSLGGFGLPFLPASITCSPGTSVCKFGMGLTQAQDCAKDDFGESVGTLLPPPSPATAAFRPQVDQVSLLPATMTNYVHVASSRR